MSPFFDKELIKRFYYQIDVIIAEGGQGKRVIDHDKSSGLLPTLRCFDDRPEDVTRDQVEAAGP